MYADPRDGAVYMKAFMLLPNQAKSFEKFELFYRPQGLGLGQGLPEKKMNRVYFLVHFVQVPTEAEHGCRTMY